MASPSGFLLVLLFSFVCSGLCSVNSMDARRAQAVNDLVGRTDTDGDGFITRAEVQAIYDSYDVDGDGVLRKVEWVGRFVERNPGAPPMIARMAAKKMFDRADRDGDGIMTLEEMSPATDQIDADNDNRISVSEFTGFVIRNMMQNMGQEQMMDSMLTAAAARLDADQDGVISEEEFRAAFGRHNVDGDDQVTRQEFMTGFAANANVPPHVVGPLANFLFQTMDRDGDNVVTRDETIPSRAEVDADENGEISTIEFKNYLKRQMSRARLQLGPQMGGGQ